MSDVLRNLVPKRMLDDALRSIYTYVRWNGVSPDELRDWGQHPFPTLREHRAIEGIAKWMDDVLAPMGTRLTTQIVWHLPDDAPNLELTSHVDVPPECMKLTQIVGVAITPWTVDNGTLRVWTRKGEPKPVELDPGDVVIMDPRAEHSPGLNKVGGPRVGLYVRWAAPLITSGSNL